MEIHLDQLIQQERIRRRGERYLPNQINSKTKRCGVRFKILGTAPHATIIAITQGRRKVVNRTEKRRCPFRIMDITKARSYSLLFDQEICNGYERREEKGGRGSSKEVI